MCIRDSPTIPNRFLNGGPRFGLFLKDILADPLNFIHQRADGIQRFISLWEGKVLGHGKKYTRKQVDKEISLPVAV